MRACGVDLDVLRKTVVHYLDTELENLVVESQEEAKATAGFQRVVQRAAIHVQSSGREEVTAPMCSSRSSPSAKATPPSSCKSRT